MSTAGQVEESQRTRFEFLRMLYELTEETKSTEILIWWIPLFLHTRKSLRLEDPSVKRTAEYLSQKGLVEVSPAEAWAGFQSSYVSITPKGIDAVEDALLHPDKPTKHFPAANITLERAATIDIFVNYREEDALVHLGPLDFRLKMAFGADRVFYAKRGIGLGSWWRNEIEQAINSCSAMLVLIGPQWLTVRDEEGHRKLDNPDDIVRWEIETALEQGKVVIPVLLASVKMPRKEDLPDSLKVLPDREGHWINGHDWERDTDALIEALEEKLVQSGAGP